MIFCFILFTPFSLKRAIMLNKCKLIDFLMKAVCKIRKYRKNRKLKAHNLLIPENDGSFRLFWFIFSPWEYQPLHFHSLKLPKKLARAIILLYLTNVRTQIPFPTKLLFRLFFIIPLRIIRRIGPAIMQKLRNGKFPSCLIPLNFIINQITLIGASLGL